MTQDPPLPAQWAPHRVRTVECPACGAKLRSQHWWTLGVWTATVGFSVPLSVFLIAAAQADEANAALKEQWLRTHDSLIGIQWHRPDLLPALLSGLVAIVLGFLIGVRRIRLIPCGSSEDGAAS